MVRLLAFLVLFCAVGPDAAKRDAWTFRDLQGKKIEPFQRKETRAVVVVFITTDCPISNYYQPTLKRLQKQFLKRGVSFVLCHSNEGSSVAEIKKHQREFRITIPVVMDADQSIARRLGARVTPEAFVVDAKGKQVYRGRIDDLYADFGKRRRAPRSHDLRDALEALLDGRKVSPAETKAVGCYIAYPKAKK